MFNYDHHYRNHYKQPDRTESKLSATNFANNFPWGDDVVLPKPSTTFRLYYQNVNGIKLDDYGGEFTEICSTLSHLQADVVGFCETKLDTTKYPVRHILSSQLKHSFSNHHLAMSTSTVPFEGYYKPGGTMSFCVDHNTSRFSARFQDPMGRWITLSLIGRNKRIVHFITVYQVVAKDFSGPYTAFQQQLQCLRLADRDIPPRRAFLIDFEKYIKSLQTPSSQFVVMGDFNEVVGTSMSGFAKITSEFRLVDVLGHFHSVVFVF
jgi:exonuclease III